MNNWSIIDPKILDKALSCCRGCYQRDIIMGNEAISGSTLKGKARQFSYHYMVSRRNLFKRITRMGLVVLERTRGHNSRILVVCHDNNLESFS